MEKSEIKSLFRLLENNSQQLSQYQEDFIKGLKKYFTKNNKLSPRQEEALANIAHTLAPELITAGQRGKK